MNTKPAVPHPAYIRWLVEYKRAPHAPNPGEGVEVFTSTVEANEWLRVAETDSSIEEAFEPQAVTIH